MPYAIDAGVLGAMCPSCFRDGVCLPGSLQWFNILSLAEKSGFLARKLKRRHEGLSRFNANLSRFHTGDGGKFLVSRAWVFGGFGFGRSGGMAGAVRTCWLVSKSKRRMLACLPSLDPNRIARLVRGSRAQEG